MDGHGTLCASLGVLVRLGPPSCFVPLPSRQRCPQRCLPPCIHLAQVSSCSLYFTPQETWRHRVQFHTFRSGRISRRRRGLHRGSRGKAPFLPSGQENLTLELYQGGFSTTLGRMEQLSPHDFPQELATCSVSDHLLTHQLWFGSLTATNQSPSGMCRPLDWNSVLGRHTRALLCPLGTTTLPQAELSNPV